MRHYKNKCPKLKASFSATTFSATFLNNKFNKNNCFIDSGANSHLTANEHLLTDKLNSREITIANHEKMPVKCSGEIKIVIVMCVPGLMANCQ